jgi:peroxiredoxin Q/BCP
VGISVDKVDAQKKHAVTCNAGYPLLSDVDGALVRQLGIANDNGNAKRTTFVVDATGVIRTVFEGVKVDGHVDEVLAAVKAL